MQYDANTNDLLVRTGATLAAWGFFALLLWLLRRVRPLRTVAGQLNLLALALFALLFLSPHLDRWHGYVIAGVEAAAVFLILIISLRGLDGLIFDLLARWRRQPPVPLVLRDLGRWAISLVALVFIIRGFFPGVNLNILAVSSIVVGYILGNATQDTLGNLVAGLALNTERPFTIGDWVTVSGHTGVVVDTTWRATRLRTKTEDYIIIPNAAIAREPITNFSRPTRAHGCYVNVGVSYETPPNRARGVILQALRDIPEVCAEPKSRVWLAGYGDSAINFTVKFFIDDYVDLDEIQTRVLDRIWYVFQRENIRIPFPIRDVRLYQAADMARAEQQAQRADIRRVLGRIELFQSLSADELDRVAGASPLATYEQGETLVRQGEEGSTFYVIFEGRVAVVVRNAEGQDVAVAHLEKDAFFGEMALLTGAARTATVIAETDAVVLVVAKTVLAPLLQANPELAGKLAAVLEKRVADRAVRMASASAADAAPLTRADLLSRIRRFFGLA
jgi:small-conductance mechanosensitive channel/CRP-like cAMP-binding protein